MSVGSYNVMICVQVIHTATATCVVQYYFLEGS